MTCHNCTCDDCRPPVTISTDQQAASIRALIDALNLVEYRDGVMLPATSGDDRRLLNLRSTTTINWDEDSATWFSPDLDKWEELKAKKVDAATKVNPITQDMESHIRDAWAKKITSFLRDINYLPDANGVYKNGESVGHEDPEREIFAEGATHVLDLLKTNGAGDNVGFHKDDTAL